MNKNYLSSDLINYNTIYNNNNNREQTKEQEEQEHDDIIAISRYEIYLPNKKNNNNNNDEDDNKRKRKRLKKYNNLNNCIYLTIQHKTKTLLDNVGEQLWRGALILSDYIIFKHNDFKDCVVFELGSGVGFLSIILSLLQFNTIYMTDYEKNIIDLGKLNIDLNNHLLPLFENENNNENNNNNNSQIHSRVLNWYQNNISRINIHELDSWNNEDKVILNSNKILWLAADVIYDELITEAFFKTISNLMNTGEHLIMSIEKRFNFTIEEMSLIAHGYNKFMNYIQGSIICEVIKDNIIIQKQFIGNRISLLFPQYIEYDRVKDIELWDIQIREL